MTPDEQMERLTAEVRAVPELAGAKNCFAGVLLKVGSGLLALGDNEMCHPLALTFTARAMAQQIGNHVLAESLSIVLEALSAPEAAGMTKPKAVFMLLEDGIMSMSGTNGMDMPSLLRNVATAIDQQCATGVVN